MSQESDYSLLDRPEVIQFIFYPRKDCTTAPPNATDHLISVDDGVEISCRLYFCDQASPSILYFHGNGEVVSDHDYVAPEYNRLGINLFVADYRGYGSSKGTPTFSNLVRDAHVISRVFKNILRECHHTGAIFVMGRSLGSIPALELASNYNEQMKGLIIESGLASLSSLMRRIGLSAEMVGLSPEFPNLTKIRDVHLPTLILHGEFDCLVPVTQGHALFDNSPAQDKRLMIIPNAGHNDIIPVGGDRYFEEIRSFIDAQLISIPKGSLQ